MISVQPARTMSRVVYQLENNLYEHFRPVKHTLSTRTGTKAWIIVYAHAPKKAKHGLYINVVRGVMDHVRGFQSMNQIFMIILSFRMDSIRRTDISFAAATLSASGPLNYLSVYPCHHHKAPFHSTRDF